MIFVFLSLEEHLKTKEGTMDTDMVAEYKVPFHFIVLHHVNQSFIHLHREVSGSVVRTLAYSYGGRWFESTHSIKKM